MTENTLPSELCHLNIAALSDLLASKQVSPVDITQALLERIEAFGSQTNAFITVTQEAALADARRCEREILADGPRSPLHGIPIAIKDIFETAGIRTTAGSKILADWVPDTDATNVAWLRAAGAIILGKCNLDEFAYGVLSDNSYFGPAHNPWDLNRATGGSSGGSAAAVAADLCIAATGSDTGGSIRIPAALCGVVGLKPTYGRVSNRGMIPLSWSLDHAGPITKSVFDAAVMLGAMAGYDPRDPASIAVPVPDFTADLRSSIAGLRIAIDPDYAFVGISDEVGTAFCDALMALADLDAMIVEVKMPRIETGVDTAVMILMAEATAYHESWLASRPNDYQPYARIRLERGFEVRGIEVGQAWHARRQFIRDFEHLFEQVDLFATPMCGIEAPRLGEHEVELNGVITPVMVPLTRFTRLFNLTGLPAISVPCGFSTDGLPIGLQLIGRAFNEATVLRAAYAYEAACSWQKRKTPTQYPAP